MPTTKLIPCKTAPAIEPVAVYPLRKIGVVHSTLDMGNGTSPSDIAAKVVKVKSTGVRMNGMK